MSGSYAPAAAATDVSSSDSEGEVKVKEATGIFYDLSMLHSTACMLHSAAQIIALFIAGQIKRGHNKFRSSKR